MEYQLKVLIDNGEHSGSVEPQYIKIKGTEKETAEQECDADFTKRGQNVTCVIRSGEYIGDYSCFTWRNGGEDALVFTQVIGQPLVDVITLASKTIKLPYV